jgi:membrane associated rhomboid family serine protease
LFGVCSGQDIRIQVNSLAVARPDPFKSLQRFIHRTGAPVTLILFAVTILSFLIAWLGSGSAEMRAAVGRLAFVPAAAIEAPWTGLTYVLANIDPLTTLFVCVGLFFFAAPLESRWGSQRFLFAFTLFTLAAPLAFWLGFEATGTAVALQSPGLPVACCLVCWATLSPEAQILLYGVLPLKAKWVGWLTAAMVVIGYGYGMPLLGAFACLPLVLAWAMASGRLTTPGPKPRGRVAREGDYKGNDLSKRLEAEQERRRLKELFERSFKDDPGDDDAKTR